MDYVGGLVARVRFHSAVLAQGHRYLVQSLKVVQRREEEVVGVIVGRVVADAVYWRFWGEIERASAITPSCVRTATVS